MGVFVRVKNLGHLAALITTYKVVPRTVDMDAKAQEALVCDQAIAQSPQRVGDTSFELPEDHTQTLFISFGVPQQCPAELRGFVGQLTITYRDFTHVKAYSQELTFTATRRN